MEAPTVAAATRSLRLNPDAEIIIDRSAKDMVTIIFLNDDGRPDMSLNPQLAANLLVLTGQLIRKRKLPEELNLATISWSTVCLLAQLQLGGAVAMRAVEQHQPLPPLEAQAVFMQLVGALGRTFKIDPFHIGQALSTCVHTLGTGADDLHQVTQPLRRTSEVTGVVVGRA